MNTNIARTFRKKPVEVEAIRFSGTTESGHAIMEWMGVDTENGETDENQAAFWKCFRDSIGRMNVCDISDHVLGIHTTEGVMECKPGWYVIKGVEGEFYPCSPSVFAATYDLVTEEAVTE